MAEETSENTKAAEMAATPPTGRGRNEVALEMMKFIAVQTGYGKGNVGGAGFSGKPSSRSVEEHAQALLELFERCRTAIGPDSDK